MPGTVPTIVFTFFFFETPVLSFFKTFPYQFPRQKTKSDNYAGNGSHNSFYFFLSRKLVRPSLEILPLRGIFEDWSEQTSSRDEMATIRFAVGSGARKPKTQQPEIRTSACYSAK